MINGANFLFMLLNLVFFVTKNVQCVNVEEIRSVFQERSNDVCVSAILDNPSFLQFVDASGKIPSGVFEGNFAEFGSFDSCYYTKIKVHDVEMDGKYCLNFIPIDFNQMAQKDLKPNRDLQLLTPVRRSTREDDEDSQDMYGLQFQIGYCVPSVCQAENLQNISDTIFGMLNTTLRAKFREKWCYSKATDPELTNGAIATIVFLSIIFAIVLLSTLYEYYLNYFEKKPLHEILLAFSLINNGKKLITSTTNPDQLLCLNGIRALSMIWVLIGHDYMSMRIGAIQNSFETYKIMSSTEDMWLMSSPLSVDTFFAVGGLVTVYSFLKSIDKGVKFNIPLYYLHRYLRLTPALGVMVLLHYNLLTYMGNGPLWINVKENLADQCHNNWWSGLLYLQNFINVPDTCVPQSWYLSVDFQLFLLSPIVLFPLAKWPKIAYGILGLLVHLGIIVPAVVTSEYELSGFLGIAGNNPDPATAQLDYMRYYYFQTHARFGPYIIGMIFGIIVYKMKKLNLIPEKTNRNKMLALCLWLVALTGLVACVYAGADLMTATEYDRVGNAFFNGFNRNAWALSVCLVIILCVADFGGPINDFLSTPIFQFLSKVSYSMYLVHYSYLFMVKAAQRTPFYFSHFQMAHVFWGHFAFSLGFAIILCLCFESPVIILEKYLLGNGSSKSRKVKTEQKEPAV